MDPLFGFGGLSDLIHASEAVIVRRNGKVRSRRYTTDQKERRCKNPAEALEVNQAGLFRQLRPHSPDPHPDHSRAAQLWART